MTDKLLTKIVAKALTDDLNAQYGCSGWRKLGKLGADRGKDPEEHWVTIDGQYHIERLARAAIDAVHWWEEHDR